jgi:hypothetical protein
MAVLLLAAKYVLFASFIISNISAYFIFPALIEEISVHFSPYDVLFSHT